MLLLSQYLCFVGKFLYEHYSGNYELRDTFSLVLNYRDPFLEADYVAIKQNIVSRQKVISPPAITVQLAPVNFSFLAEIPSAEEVEENGVNLGEMNTLLAKKIEELTLHLIERFKEQTEKFEQRIEEQQREIDKLRNKR